MLWGCVSGALRLDAVPLASHPQFGDIQVDGPRSSRCVCVRRGGLLLVRFDGMPNLHLWFLQSELRVVSKPIWELGVHGEPQRNDHGLAVL